MPLLRQQFAAPHARFVFIDDGSGSESVNDHPIWTFERFLREPASLRGAAVAIAKSGIREMLDWQCRDAGVELLGITASNVVVMDDVQVGPGALLSPFVTLTSNIRIGRCFHGNLYSYVEHDCVIGDYVTFAPGVHCNGNVTIGDHAYVGSGAVIRQGLTIGAGATVGMGAVVTKDVPPGVTVVGNPARAMEEK